VGGGEVPRLLDLKSYTVSTQPRCKGISRFSLGDIDRCPPGLRAYIFIRTKPGTSENVVKRIRERVSETILADSIYGRFDAIVVVDAPSFDRLNEIVYRVIASDPDIIHTETSLTLS
jgi:DNA-binding Lrp family transcriptional regulator